MESIRRYQTVGANSSVSVGVAIPTGVTAQIRRFGGNASYNGEVKVEVKYGTDILFSTHGDDQQDYLCICVVGDGSDLAVFLVNDSSSSETIGCYVDYELVET